MSWRWPARAQVQAATPLSSEQVTELASALSKAVRRDVTVEAQVAPELLGGAVAQVGSLFDGSIKGQLRELRREPGNRAWRLALVPIRERRASWKSGPTKSAASSSSRSRAMGKRSRSPRPVPSYRRATESPGVYGFGWGQQGELLEFPGDLKGLVLNLEEDNVGVALMGEYSKIRREIPFGARAVSPRSRLARRWWAGWWMLSDSPSMAGVRLPPSRPARSRSRFWNRGPQVSPRAAADRPQGHRRHDSGGTGAARAGSSAIARPASTAVAIDTIPNQKGQDVVSDLRRGDRPEAVDRRPGGRSPAEGRGHGIPTGRRGQRLRYPGPAAVSPPTPA